MGSFYSTCSVCSMTLVNEPTSIILLVRTLSGDLDECKDMIVSNDGCQSIYAPFSFPIHGVYDDYGNIREIKKDMNTDMLENYFGIDIDLIVNNLGRTRDIPKNVKNVDVYASLSKTYIRTEVLEYLESGWDTSFVTLANKFEYTIDRLYTAFDKRSDSLSRYDGKEPSSDVKRLIASIESMHSYDIMTFSPVSTLVNNHMYKVFPIDKSYEEYIFKQKKFLNNLSFLRKTLMPSAYGSQSDNWVEIYKFNNFVNDIVADSLKKKLGDMQYWASLDGDSYEDSELEGIVKSHTMIVRDRKLNQLI